MFQTGRYSKARRNTTPSVRRPSMSGREAARLGEIENLAKVMDAHFRLPGTRIRFGFDAIVGLIPGFGDTLGAAVSSYIIYHAWRLGMPFDKLVRMAGNVMIDLVVGAVPIFGDILDAGWKANQRNARLVREHLEARAFGTAETRSQADVYDVSSGALDGGFSNR